jgi:hypothetical protein
MAQPSAPEPLKYVVAILYRLPEALEAGKRELVARWGPLDFEGADHAFDMTGYYEAEMGAPLSRRLLAFECLRPPTDLVAIKLGCNAIEDALAVEGKRRVNLDAGYLDHNKVVLASAKARGQKIYLDRGIYADLVSIYNQGAYQPFPWTFPDFADQRYHAELLAVRRLYLQQMRTWRAQPSCRVQGG